MSYVTACMRIQCEVLVLNDEIRREYQIFVRFGPEHGAVVANAMYQTRPAGALFRETSNHANKIRFAHGFALLRRTCQHETRRQRFAIRSAGCR
jgi:hypothetical protein